MGNTHRQCAVQIHNNSKNFLLCSPMVYLDSGRCLNTLTATIGPHQHGSGLFTKTPYTACGSVGVFTYDLYNVSTKKHEKKMAVMFSNPYDFNLNSNLYAAGIFDNKQPCDHSLFSRMYNDTETEFVRRAAGYDLTYKGDGMIISASMTDTYEPDLEISISSKDD